MPELRGYRSAFYPNSRQNPVVSPKNWPAGPGPLR